MVVREEQQKRQYNRVEEELNGEQLIWEQEKTRKKDKERRKMVKGSRKVGLKGSSIDIRTRRMEDDMGRHDCSRDKKLRYEKGKEDWGAPVTMLDMEKAQPKELHSVEY